jgi:hypothetical protein
MMHRLFRGRYILYDYIPWEYSGQAGKAFIAFSHL